MLDFSLLYKFDKDMYYLPSEQEPILSADIGFFIGGNFVWCYDCGASEQAYNCLKQIDNINIVISHFHNDHTGNMLRLTNINEYYVGNYTYKHFNKGIVVDNDLYVEDNGLVHIFGLPNSHSKGSLAMEVNEKYVFIGDTSYGKRLNGHIVYNAQLLLEQYRKLSAIKADLCLQSHEMNNAVEKSMILAKFEKILSKRKKDEPNIIL